MTGPSSEFRLELEPQTFLAGLGAVQFIVENYERVDDPALNVKKEDMLELSEVMNQVVREKQNPPSPIKFRIDRENLLRLQRALMYIQMDYDEEFEDVGNQLDDFVETLSKLLNPNEIL